MPAYFFRSEPGAAELRRLARQESGRVCQRVLMIANLLEGMEHEAAARLAGLSRSTAYEWHNRYEEDGIEGLRDRPRPGRQPRVDRRHPRIWASPRPICLVRCARQRAKRRR
ncbi:MAG: helix-turn-helix domain-containing protein [Alphaproteobacteria bacterium]|nr:helix-turn-helix domain-containing protein [Alphaproteobacteria bacterium]